MLFSCSFVLYIHNKLSSFQNVMWCGLFLPIIKMQNDSVLFKNMFLLVYFFSTSLLLLVFILLDMQNAFVCFITATFHHLHSLFS